MRKRCLQLSMVVLAGCVGVVQDDARDASSDTDAGTAHENAGVPDASSLDGGSPEPVDSGALDAGGADASVDAGLGCQAQFCDDFERATLGSGVKAPWVASVNGGAIVIDGAHTHSGDKAVKVTTDGQSSYRRAYFSVQAPFLPVAGNRFYGRMWVYLTAAPPTTTHWTNISGEGQATYSGKSFASYVRYGGQVSKKLMANYDSQSSVYSSDCWQHSEVPFPEKRWACMEWLFDGSTNSMEFWLDGTQVSALTVHGQGMGCIKHDLADNWVFPQFETLRLGWEHYQTSIPIEMWVDDVALDVAKIGCQ